MQNLSLISNLTGMHPQRVIALRRLWAHEKLYTIHCATFAVALSLRGIVNIIGTDRGIATRGDDPLATFRAYPQYRTAAARLLRQLTAAHVRRERNRTH